MPSSLCFVIACSYNVIAKLERTSQPRRLPLGLPQHYLQTKAPRVTLKSLARALMQQNLKPSKNQRLSEGKNRPEQLARSLPTLRKSCIRGRSPSPAARRTDRRPKSTDKTQNSKRPTLMPTAHLSYEFGAFDLAIGARVARRGCARHDLQPATSSSVCLFIPKMLLDMWHACRPIFSLLLNK